MLVRTTVTFTGMKGFVAKKFLEIKSRLLDFLYSKRTEKQCYTNSEIYAT